MPILSETMVTLRFFGDELNPDEITEMLGSVPTIAVSKGGTWLTSLGKEKTAKTGSWRLQVPDASPGDLNAQIEALFANLTTDFDIWERLSQRFEADIFCGLFLEEPNEGIGLKAETLKAIGCRHLKLDLDIYGSPSDG